MDIYETIQPLLLKKTPFVFIRNHHLEIYEDVKSDEPFAILDCKGKQITIILYEFIDWTSIKILLKLGHYILKTFNDQHPEYSIHTVVIECSCDMNDELIYDFKMNERPWYAWEGYIPHLKNNWSYSKTNDFYQLPFLKPRNFLELNNGKILIHPRAIILQRKDPLLLIAQKDPNDLHLRLLPSTSFYSISKRPINSMFLLRQRSFQLLDLSKVPSNIIKSGAPFKIGEDFYVPVVRYSNGMRNGCYFESKKECEYNYLGTFYYWEPESGCYLKMGKNFDFFENKFDCATKMMYKLEQYDEITGGENPKISKLFKKLEKYTHQILNELGVTFKKNYYEEYQIFENNVLRNDSTSEPIDHILEHEFISVYIGEEAKYLPITKEYKSTVSYTYMKSLFYAMEDELDQVLAQVLILFGYDVVIFGRMAGMYRVVSEVLDVRTREDSLRNLCWRVD
jgi:hypothetical protein